MSTPWRCAVCEAVNQGGDTCAACGARVTQTVVQAQPPETTAVPERTAAPEGARAPEPTLGDDAATEIPVRELPRRRLEPDRPDLGPYEIYDLIDLTPADIDAAYDGYERIDTRPRVRVYGCCLPIALGMLLVLVVMVTFLGNLVLAAL
jgi:hypothetical protein